jgi:hypothetical protein
MLFSKNFKMNDKDYEMKINVRTRLNFKKQGIDITDKKQMEDEETLFKLCAIACNTKLDTFIDDFDLSNITMDELAEIIGEAIELGVNKGKKKDDSNDNSEDNEEKNS